MFFWKFDFTSYGPREPFIVTRRGADVWWDASQEVDGVHIFHARNGGVGSVTIDDPHNQASVKAAAKALGVPRWWLRRKINQLAD